MTEIPVYIVVCLDIERSEKIIQPDCYFSRARAIEVAREMVSAVTKGGLYAAEKDNGEDFIAFHIDIKEDWQDTFGYGTNVKHMVWVMRCLAQTNPLEWLAEQAE